MNPITVSVLLACLAFASAQLPAPTDTAAATSTGVLGGAGPLQNVVNPATANSVANTNNYNNLNNNNMGGMNQLLRNPFYSYMLGGGDNMMRAFMTPAMSRFGSLPAYYYLQGGMDKFTKVYLSDQLNRMFARSTGMNPIMSSLFTSQWTDAPDNYFMNNMLFNGMGMQQQQQQTPNQMQAGAGANSAGTNSFNPFFLAPFMF